MRRTTPTDTTRERPRPGRERYLSIPEVAARLGTTDRFPRRLVGGAPNRVQAIRASHPDRRERPRHLHRILHGGARDASAAGGLMSGNSKGRRRRFGSVRRLPSGLWQARYLTPDDQMVPAPVRFADRKAAEDWLVQTEAEMLRGDWTDPTAGQIELGTYVDEWMRDRDLKARTREEYERLIRLHVRPQLGRRVPVRHHAGRHPGVANRTPGQRCRTVHGREDVSHPARGLRDGGRRR